MIGRRWRERLTAQMEVPPGAAGGLSAPGRAAGGPAGAIVVLQEEVRRVLVGVIVGRGGHEASPSG